MSETQVSTKNAWIKQVQELISIPKHSPKRFLYSEHIITEILYI